MVSKLSMREISVASSYVRYTLRSGGKADMPNIDALGHELSRVQMWYRN